MPDILPRRRGHRHRLSSAPRGAAHQIWHNWNDRECITILANLRAAATGPRRAFIAEHIIPGPNEPHVAKLFDIHMLCWGTGRERTEAEYAQLLGAAGFRHRQTWYPAGRLMGVVEGVAA